MLGLAEANDLRRRAKASCRQWIPSSAEEGGLGGLSPAEDGSMGDARDTFTICTR